MACVGALRTCGAPAPLTLVLWKMRSDLLNTLKAFIEHGIATGEWDMWWTMNATAVEQNLGRFAYLNLAKNGFKGVHDVLRREGIVYKPSDDHCQSCGAHVFRRNPQQYDKRRYSQIHRIQSKSKHQREHCE